MFSMEKIYFIDEKIDEIGPIEPDKDHVREEPYSLPPGFEWDTIDLGDKSQVTCVILIVFLCYAHYLDISMLV